MLPARLAEGVNVTVLPLTFTVPVIGVPPAVAASLTLAVVSVELFIGSVNVADTEEFSGTAIAPPAGDVVDTVGGVVSGIAAVTKFHVKLAASALPAASFTPVVTVAVYGVLGSRLAEGVKVAVLLLTLTVPATTAPPVVATRVKLPMFTVELVIASEKVADIEEFVATPIAPFAGDTAETAGGVVSVLTPVVKFQVKLPANALPAASLAAVVIVAVYCVFPTRAAAGVNVAVLPLVVTVPLTAIPPVARVKLVVVSVELVIGSEKLADIDEFRATPVAAFDGEVSDTVGGFVSEIVDADEVDSPGTSSGDAPPPPPPPQPNRLTCASKIAKNMPP